MTLEEVFDKFIPYYEENELSEDTLEGHKSAYKLCKNLHSQPFAAITFDQWQQTIRESGKNRLMLLNVKNMLSKPYKYAYVHGVKSMMMQDQILYMDVGLTESEEKTVSSDTKSEKIHRLFTWAEMAALWERKNEEPIKWILFLIYICMRSKEMLTVKKSDMSLEEIHII